MSLSKIWNWVRSAPKPKGRKPAPRRPGVEVLEDRSVPATLVALTSAKELLTFDSASPGVILNTVKVTGTPASLPLLGLDVRPSTGQLYTMTRNALYTVDANTGVATLHRNFSTPLTNVAATGFDFNPAVDRLRVASATGRNLRINPDTGAVTVDAALQYDVNGPDTGRTPNVVGSAYTNPDNDSSSQNPTATALFGIDYVRNTLVQQNPANNGTLTTIGTQGLGVDVSAAVGFDVGFDGIAYMSSGNANNTQSLLYTVNLTTGVASAGVQIGSGKLVYGLTALLPATPVYAVTSTNALVTFNAPTPEIITSSRPITGLAGGETITGIDFRPSTGELYATSSINRVYVINTATAAATRVNGGNFNGGQFGMDFNPVPDALRVVSDAEQNARIPLGGRGTQVNDTALAYAGNTPNPNVVGAAYTNNFPGATETTLYGIDSGNNALVRIGDVNGTPNSPNGGVLTVVGNAANPLGVDVGSNDFVGFDISTGGTAYAAMQLEGQTTSRFYTINLTTGAATAAVGSGAATDGDANNANNGVIGSIRSGTGINTPPVIVGIAVAPPVVRFQRVAVSTAESASNVRLAVVRSGDTSATATVNYDFFSESAQSPGDFTATPATVAFAPGNTIATFLVPIIEESTTESGETFAVGLSRAAGQTFTLDPGLVQAVVTILANDGGV